MTYERTSLNTLEWLTDFFENKNVTDPSSVLCLTLCLNVSTRSNAVLIHFHIAQWYLDTCITVQLKALLKGTPDVSETPYSPRC